MREERKCLNCGARMTARRERYHYKASGLDNVYLEGVKVARCMECGEHEVEIPAIEALHRGIAWALVEKKPRLAPKEILFLRKYLGLLGKDFADHMGTRPETVSRWENGSAQMGAVADRLLRTMVIIREPMKDYAIEALKTVATGEPRRSKIQLRNVGSHGWRAA